MQINKKTVADKKPQPKVFHFFETVTNTVFVSIIGSFATLFLIFLSLSVLFFSPLYNQFVIFTGIGAIFFSLSRLLYTRSHIHCLRNLTYKAFLASRKDLFFWVIWTLSFYLMLCWFMLIVLGSTHGFHIKFPTSDNSHALLITNEYTTKITGVILWSVHIFILILVKTISYYWARIFAFAHSEFEKRRKNLAIVRSKANL